MCAYLFSSIAPESGLVRGGGGGHAAGEERESVYTEILFYTMVVFFWVAEWLSWVESCGYNDRRGRSVGLSLFSPFLCTYAYCIHT